MSGGSEQPTVLYFNISAVYGAGAEIYIDQNLIMILLALLNLYMFEVQLHTDSEKNRRRENKLVCKGG